MKNKIILFAVFIVMLLAAIPASAAVTEDDGITALMKELSIMQGDENGDMMLDKKVSRAEFAKIAVAASPNKNSVALGLRQSPFRDVRYTEWYAPYVKASVTAGYVVGYLDATFRPENTVTYEEAATILLRVLGYDDTTFTDAYPYGQLAKAQSIEILDDIDAQIGEELTRYKVMRMVYNALDAMQNVSAGTPTKLITVHECSATENVDIISTNEQDDSLGEDKVYTSNGTYTKGQYFSNESAGMTGTIYLKNNRDIVAFVPDNKTQNEYDTYFIYSILQNSTIVGYKGGQFEKIDIPNNATVYDGQTKTSYAAVKSNLKMGDTLYIKRTPNGSVDYLTYDTNNLEGPVKVTSDGWLTELGAANSSTVFRSGVESSISDVQKNDIAYYSEPLDVIFVYTDKVTGVYEKASPTKDSPETVTVSGKDYKVESVEAFSDLSSSGTYKYGDTVTILLGKTGEIAGVADSGAANGKTAISLTSGRITGYVIETGRKDFTDSDNNVYTSYYAKVVTADGNENEVQTKTDVSSYISKIVNVYIERGKAVFTTKKSDNSVFGYVDAISHTVGDSKLADNVNILDTSGSISKEAPSYSKVYIQRIDKINISSSKVIYYSKNENNEIDNLILSDVTGDCYTYGMVTSNTKLFEQKDNPKTKDINEALSIYSGEITIDIDGVQNNYQTQYTSSVTGPKKLIMSGNNLVRMFDLNTYGGNITSLTRTDAVIGGRKYKLSDKVIVYERTGPSTYMKIPLDTAIKGNYRMIAHYDKAEDLGGRIRIIVAQAE